MKVRCSFCRAYIDRDSAVRKSIQAFCSEEHFLEYVNANRKKQIVKHKKRLEDLSSGEKLEIIKLDEYRCRFCGTEYNLHVHHAKYRSEGGSNDPDNLITLCYKHHDIVHSNKKKYQPLCLNLIELRNSGKLKKFITILDLEN